MQILLHSRFVLMKWKAELPEAPKFKDESFFNVSKIGSQLHLRNSHLVTNLRFIRHSTATLGLVGRRFGTAPFHPPLVATSPPAGPGKANASVAEVRY